jgi:site-specific DNA-methyltransferase (adenine-specific)
MLQFVTDNIHFQQQDVLDVLPGFSNDFFDLCIVDPPYGASTIKKWSYGDKEKIPGFGGKWKIAGEIWDLLSQNDSFTSTFAWLKELRRVVKPTGSIWIHSTYHNSGFVNVCCQLLGLEIINEIVWYKRNAFPNLSGRRLTASHETILWVHKGTKREYRFNYEESKTFFSGSDLLKKQGKQMRTVWDIPNNKSKDETQFGLHPTQKPIQLAERILAVAGIRKGKLLVPFAGSGTELIAGLQYGMSVFGFETKAEYFELATKRLKHLIQNLPETLFSDE